MHLDRVNVCLEGIDLLSIEWNFIRLGDTSDRMVTKLYTKLPGEVRGLGVSGVREGGWSRWCQKCGNPGVWDVKVLTVCANFGFQWIVIHQKGYLVL